MKKITFIFVSFLIILSSCEDINNLFKSDMPLIEFDSSLVSFGEVSAVGTTVEKNLELVNQGALPLIISSADFSSTLFSLKESTFPIEIAAGGKLSLVILYQSPDSVSGAAILSLMTNDPEHPVVEISLNCMGYVAPVVEPQDDVIITITGEELTGSNQPQWSWVVTGEFLGTIKGYDLILKTTKADGCIINDEFGRELIRDPEKLSWQSSILPTGYYTLTVEVVFEDDHTHPSSPFATTVDLDPPVLSLKGRNSLYLPVGLNHIDEGVNCHDAIEVGVEFSYFLYNTNDLLTPLQIGKSPDHFSFVLTTVGDIFEIKYQAVDTSGNQAEEVSRLVTVVSAGELPSSPELALLLIDGAVSSNDKTFAAAPEFSWNSVDGSRETGHQVQIKNTGGTIFIPWQDVESNDYPESTLFQVNPNPSVPLFPGKYILEVRSWQPVDGISGDRYFSMTPLSHPFEIVSHLYIDADASSNNELVPDQLGSGWLDLLPLQNIPPAPGITINFEGNFSNKSFYVGFSGTPNHRITLDAGIDAGNSFFFDAVTTNNVALSISKANYITIENAVLDNCKVRIGFDSGNITVQNMLFKNTSSGIELPYDSHDINISSSVFTKCEFPIQLVKSLNVIIENSYIDSCTNTVLSSRNTELIFRNNVLLNNSWSSEPLIVIEAGTGDNQTDVQILNNTFYYNASFFSGSTQGGTFINNAASNTVFSNNIITSAERKDGDPMELSVAFNLSTTPVESISHNLFGPRFCEPDNPELSYTDFPQSFVISRDPASLAVIAPAEALPNDLLSPFVHFWAGGEEPIAGISDSMLEVMTQPLTTEQWESLVTPFTPSRGHYALDSGDNDICHVPENDMLSRERVATMDIGALENPNGGFGSQLVNGGFELEFSRGGFYYCGEFSKNGTDWSPIGSFEDITLEGGMGTTWIVYRSEYTSFVYGDGMLKHKIENLKNYCAIQPVYLEAGNTYDLTLSYAMNKEFPVKVGVIYPNIKTGGFQIAGNRLYPTKTFDGNATTNSIHSLPADGEPSATQTVDQTGFALIFCYMQGAETAPGSSFLNIEEIFLTEQ